MAKLAPIHNIFFNYQPLEKYKNFFFVYLVYFVVQNRLDIF